MMFKFLNDLFGKKNVEQKPRELRMYVLVREDLSSSYKMVQGAHALAEYALRSQTQPDTFNPTLYKVWKNQYLIFLGVRNYMEMKEWFNKMVTSGKQFAPFYEPDLDYQLTAIACIDTGEIFERLPLAR